MSNRIELSGPIGRSKVSEDGRTFMSVSTDNGVINVAFVAHEEFRAGEEVRIVGKLGYAVFGQKAALEVTVLSVERVTPTAPGKGASGGKA
jgi:hypothetical protein